MSRPFWMIMTLSHSAILWFGVIDCLQRELPQFLHGIANFAAVAFAFEQTVLGLAAYVVEIYSTDTRYAALQPHTAAESACVFLMRLNGTSLLLFVLLPLGPRGAKV